jgi:hypothetical protein
MFFKKKDNVVELFDIRPVKISLPGDEEAAAEIQAQENIRLARNRSFRDWVLNVVWRLTENLLFLVLGSIMIFYPRVGFLTLIRNILAECFPEGQYTNLDQFTIIFFALLCIWIHQNTIRRHIEIILCEKRCIDMGITDFLFDKFYTTSKEVERQLMRTKWFSYLGETLIDRMKDSAINLVLYFLIVFNVAIFFCILVVLSVPILRLIMQIQVKKYY